MDKLILATRNAHKAEEIRAILGDQFRYLTLNHFPGVPAVEEDANTFAGNATKKAVALARWLASAAAPFVSENEHGQTFVLADDSGLEVDALNGAPGVHSARFAALETGRVGNSPDAENLARLLKLLRDVPTEKRGARFRCVLALTPVILAGATSSSPTCCEFEMETELFDGVCEGRLSVAPHGQGGFGYDPAFIPEGQERTFGELGEEIKNRLSHRARALAGLKQRLAGRGGA